MTTPDPAEAAAPRVVKKPRKRVAVPVPVTEPIAEQMELAL